MDLQKKLMSIKLTYYMIFFLSVLALYNIFAIGITETLPQLLIVIITASLLDIFINYVKSKQIIRPYNAVITAIFIGTLLPIGQKWYIPVTISAIAIISKHLVNINKRHIFNPAILGLFFAALLFKQPLQWWTSTPFPLVLLFGLFVSYKFKRFHLTLSYIITSLILWAIFSLATNNPLTIGILNINYFFIFFMLVEPMSSPIYKKGRIIYGSLAAVLAFIFSFYIISFDPNNIALIAANLFVPLINKYIRS